MTSKANNLRRRPSPLGALVGLVGLLALPVTASSDIYRFVTVDGVETFTDVPQDRQARVVIRARPGRKGVTTKNEKKHDISLDEVMSRTIQASLTPRQDGGTMLEARLPLTGGVISSGVGVRRDPIDGRPRHHNGIDIAIAEGTPVRSVGPGVVIYSGARSGYGNTVIVEHGNGLVTLYAHNSRLLVSDGQMVDETTIIALTGNTGRSTGPHLHFEAWQAGNNLTAAFMPGSGKRLSFMATTGDTRIHREVMADGSILFTNIPTKIR